MVFEGLFVIEVLYLFFTSKTVSKSIFSLFYKLTHNRRASVTFLSLIFFPGVLIHELSHLFMASILFVPVGEMELMPKVEGESVRLGSVQVAETDIFRRFLIGVAPVLLGGSLLLFIIFYFSSFFSVSVLSSPQVIIDLIFLYIVFVISNTMFSSRKDMEGAFGFLIIFFLILFGVIFAGGQGLREGIVSWILQEKLVNGFYYVDILFLIPIVINSLFVLISLRKQRIQNLGGAIYPGRRGVDTDC